jgi:hypothetical protein
MKITCWYKNGSIDAIRQFCNQNQNKPISITLTNRSEPVVGTLYSYFLESSKAAHIFVLLTDRVTHPAYYGLEGIECLHIKPHKACPHWADKGYNENMLSSEIMASNQLAQISA